MATPATADSAYTLLEALLLFHNLSTHGAHPSSFSLISSILLKNPLVNSDKSYDRGRLSPDALREFYEAWRRSQAGGDYQSHERSPGNVAVSPTGLRKRKAKTPPATSAAISSGPDWMLLIQNATSDLYRRYKETVFQQIREEEKRYTDAQRDIQNIKAGLWDERLVKDAAARSRSRSRSVSEKPTSLEARVGLSPAAGADKRAIDSEPIVHETPPHDIAVGATPTPAPGRGKSAGELEPVVREKTPPPGIPPNPQLPDVVPQPAPVEKPLATPTPTPAPAAQQPPQPPAEGLQPVKKPLSVVRAPSPAPTAVPAPPPAVPTTIPTPTPIAPQPHAVQAPVQRSELHAPTPPPPVRTAPIPVPQSGPVVSTPPAPPPPPPPQVVIPTPKIPPVSLPPPVPQANSYEDAHAQMQREGSKVATTIGSTATSPVVAATPVQTPSTSRPSSKGRATPIHTTPAPPKMDTVQPLPSAAPPAPPATLEPMQTLPLQPTLGVKIESSVPPAPTPRAILPPLTPRNMTGPPRHLPPMVTQSPLPHGSPPVMPNDDALRQLADVANGQWARQQSPPAMPTGHRIPFSAPGQYMHPAVSQPGYSQPLRAQSTTASGNFGILYPPNALGVPIAPSPNMRQLPLPQPSFSPPYVPYVPQSHQPHSPPPPPQMFSPGQPLSRPPFMHQQQQQQHRQPIMPPPQPLPSTPVQGPHVSPRKVRPSPISTSLPSLPHTPALHDRPPNTPPRPGPEDIEPLSPLTSPSVSPPGSPKTSPATKGRGKKRSLADVHAERPPSPGKPKVEKPQKEEKESPVAKRAKSATSDNEKEEPPPTRGGRGGRRGRGRGRGGWRGGPRKAAAPAAHSPPPPESPGDASAERTISPEEPSAQPKEEDVVMGGTKRKTPGPELIIPESTTSRPPPTLVPSTPHGKDPADKRRRTFSPDRSPKTLDADHEGEGEGTPERPPAASASAAAAMNPFRPPKIEPQSSSTTVNVPSPAPAPLVVPVGAQPTVVATKKFSTLVMPLLANIGSHRFANLFSVPVGEKNAPGYGKLVFRPQDLKNIKAAVRFGAASIMPPLRTGTPSNAPNTPTTDTPPSFPPPPPPFALTSGGSFSASGGMPANTTSVTIPATTFNTPPRGIVNSLQLEKEVFRMFANAVMYNKSSTEIAKEVFTMSKDVEGMMDNFRAAEEAGTRKALFALSGRKYNRDGSVVDFWGGRKGDGASTVGEGSVVGDAMDGSVAGDLPLDAGPALDMPPVEMEPEPAKAKAKGKAVDTRIKEPEPEDVEMADALEAEEGTGDAEDAEGDGEGSERGRGSAKRARGRRRKA